MATAKQLDRSDKKTLERLNQKYVDAFMDADVEWYREHLAEDFVVIESDGSVLNKDQFLTNTAKGPDVNDYTLQHVNVRIYGEVVLVRATGTWTGKNGSAGMSPGFWQLGGSRQSFCQSFYSILDLSGVHSGVTESQPAAW